MKPGIIEGTVASLGCLLIVMQVGFYGALLYLAYRVVTHFTR